MLVGITDYDQEGNAVAQAQFAGRVISAGEKGILLRLADGGSYLLPPDLSSTKPAPPGCYRLRSTGEVVENPDYLSVWNRTKDS